MAGERDATIKSLVARVEAGEHWDRVEAIEKLGALKAPRAVEVLKEVLAPDARECWHTRTAALRALAAIGAADAGDLCVHWLREGDDPDVRIAAAEALAALATPGAEISLRMVAAREAGKDVGIACQAALARLTGRPV